MPFNGKLEIDFRKSDYLKKKYLLLKNLGIDKVLKYNQMSMLELI